MFEAVFEIFSKFIRIEQRSCNMLTLYLCEYCVLKAVVGIMPLNVMNAYICVSTCRRTQLMRGPRLKGCLNNVV